MQWVYCTHSFIIDGSASFQLARHYNEFRYDYYIHMHGSAQTFYDKYYILKISIAKHYHTKNEKKKKFINNSVRCTQRFIDKHFKAKNNIYTSSLC